MRLKKYLLVLSLLFATTAFPAPPLKVLVSTLPQNPDPVTMWNYQHFIIVQSLFDTLIRYSEEGNMIGNLAKKWSITEKGTLYTFELDHTKKFTDGTPVTAKDVHLSFSRHFWKGSKSVIVDNLSEVLDCPGELKKNELLPCLKVLGPTTISFRLRAPYPPFLNVLSMLGYCVHKMKPDGSFMGSGPFVLKSYNSKTWKFARKDAKKFPANVPSGLELTKFENIKDAQQYVDSNNVDLIVGLAPALLSSLKLKSAYGVMSHQSMAFSHFYTNSSKPPFNNPSFRKAFRAFFEEKVLNATPVKDDFFSRMNKLICPGLMPRNYYKKNSLWDKKYEEVMRQEKSELLLVFREDYTEELLFKNLDKVILQYGLNWKVKRIDSAHFMEEINAKKYHLITGAYLASFPDPDGFISPINRKNSLQYGVFDTAPLFKEITSLRNIEDKMKRLNKYASVLNNFEDQNYIIPGYQFYLPIVFRKGLRVPNWNYKHEGEFWNIIWESKVEGK